MNSKYNMGGSKADIIGQGSYGTVIKGVRIADLKSVAIKRCSYCPVQGCPPTALRECAALKALQGRKNIVQLLDFYMDSSFISIVMPLYHSDLHSFIRKHPDGIPHALTRHLSHQIIGGLIACHENGIIHRDLKPTNILINGADCSLVIADFGMARFSFLKDTQLTREVVTLTYRPPELLRGNETNVLASPYAYTVDIWALGCILFEMRTGRVLFRGDEILDQVERVHDPDSPLRRLIHSPYLHEVVVSTLALDPSARPSTFALMSMSYFADE